MRGWGGARLFFCCGYAARFFFAVGAPLPGAVGRSGGIQWGVARPAGGRVYFFAAGARRVFFLLWVRGRFAHSLAAGVGLGNPIGHGLRRGLCGAGGARLFFCCGCAARGWAGQAESNGAWAGQPGGAFSFLLRVLGAFFFLLWVRGRFAHSLAAGVGLGNPIGHGLRRGLCRAGGARLFFCCGCSARFFFLLWVRPCPGLGRRNAMGRGPALFFCCGCAARFFFVVGARQVRSLTCCRGGTRESNWPWSPYTGLVRGGRGGGAFIFCCGCALARGSAGQAESNGAWAGQPGGALIFLLWVRGAFFFLLWVRGRFAHSLAAGRLRASTAERHPGSVARFFFCCGCASSGGARLFFCCGCAARLFFCCGCASSLTHSLAARRPESTNSQKAHTTKKKHGFRVRGGIIY